MHKLLLAWLLGVLVLSAGEAEARSESPERIVWRKTPIALELRVGAERLVHFPGAVQVGMPAPLQDRVRIQSIAGTLYLLAHEPFARTRVVVRGLGEGPIYLLDVSAHIDSAGTGPVAIFDPDEAHGERKPAQSEHPGGSAYGYVTLTRFAAQQLYAPARLLNVLPGVVRVPVKREPVALVRGAALDAGTTHCVARGRSVRHGGHAHQHLPPPADPGSENAARPLADRHLPAQPRARRRQ